jgi:hypothetical protein
MIGKERPLVDVCISHLCTELAIDHSLGDEIRDKVWRLPTENECPTAKISV